MSKTTWRKVDSKVALTKPSSAFAPEHVWSNADMGKLWHVLQPVPQHEWTWGPGTFAAYWFSDLINAGSWSQVSAFVVLGLTWWQSVLAVFVGGLLLSIVIALNGVIGARLHTPFAISSRAPFGYIGSRFPVVSRMIIAWFWFSVNSYQGGLGVKLMLNAIWPSFRNFKNHLPASSGTTSQDMLCFFLFWLSPTAAWVQVAAVPLLWTTTSLLGAITSNMALAIYGEVLFQPFDIIDKWLIEPSSGGRAAAFFCSLAWALGNATTNLTANSISAANDMAVLFPKYINLRRGQLFCVFVGCWAFCPWLVLATASNFLSFMASYAVILAPIAAILASDYFLVHRKKYDVVALYDPSSIYRYNKLGINWRAFIALVCAAGPNLPGMAKSIEPSVDIGNLRWVFCLSILFGLTVAASVHWALHTIFPDRRSLIEEQITAVDVLAGRVPCYAHLADTSSQDGTSVDKEASVDKA
ncbi:hypothetical protein OIO90_003394 [Microbotryomycetes sp. JL221]|nr:hypothetical protein OIO90_003394 [Microbotryomycetes sp. JL221]